MQKRTRIFAAITVAVGLLLGLATFASMFLGEAASVGAAPTKKHHHTQAQTKTKTQTQTVTVSGGGSTSTITVTNTSTIVIPPPGPSCVASPNPAHIGSNALGQGDVVFTLECTGLNPNTFISTITSNIVCGFKSWDGAPEGLFSPITVNANGTASPIFFGQACIPGTYSISVSVVIGGQIVNIPATVTFV